MGSFKELYRIMKSYIWIIVSDLFQHLQIRQILFLVNVVFFI